MNIIFSFVVVICFTTSNLIFVNGSAAVDPPPYQDYSIIAPKMGWLLDSTNPKYTACLTMWINCGNVDTGYPACFNVVNTNCKAPITTALPTTTKTTTKAATTTTTVITTPAPTIPDSTVQWIHLRNYAVLATIGKNISPVATLDICKSECVNLVGEYRCAGINYFPMNNTCLVYVLLTDIRVQNGPCAIYLIDRTANSKTPGLSQIERLVEGNIFDYPGNCPNGFEQENACHCIKEMTFETCNEYPTFLAHRYDPNFHICAMEARGCPKSTTTAHLEL